MPEQRSSRESLIMTKADAASQLIRMLRGIPGPVRFRGVLLVLGVGALTCPRAPAGADIEIDYDPHKGAVLSATWQNGTPERPWARTYYELQEVDGGFWVPKTISKVYLF